MVPSSRIATRVFVDSLTSILVGIFVGILVCVPVGVPVGPCPCQGKPAQDTDWPATVEKAHKSRRIMLRRAVARKVAAAGDAAIPAVRAFEKKNGRQAIDLALVTAYVRDKGTGAATLALLEEWVRDRDFYWRSQALEALANRALAAHEELFRSRLADPAYLTRVQAGRGLCLLGIDGDRVVALLRDEDPRVRLRIAICLVERKDDRGLPTLVEALRQDASFLDYPWGPVGARTAFKALRKVAGGDHGYDPGVPVQKNKDAIDKFEEWARKRLGAGFAEPVPAHRSDTSFSGGIQIRSCRNGDLFVRWTTEGRIAFGLEAGKKVELSTAAWNRVRGSLPPPENAVHGKVVCDYLRFVCKNPTVDQKSAPSALPSETNRWLEDFAQALEESGQKGLAREITTRLDQFRTRRNNRKK